MIVFAAIGLIEPQAWRALAAVDHVEVAIAGVTTGCVVVFGVLEALVVAVGLSVIDTVRRSASPHDAVLGWVERLGRYADVSLHPTARVTPGVVVYRLDDRLFFANARYFKGRVREAIRAAPTPVSWLVLRRRSGHARRLDRARRARRGGEGLTAHEITLVVARLRTRMEEELEAAGVTETIGRERFYPTVRAAVAACVSAQEPRRPKASGHGHSPARDSDRASLRCDVLVQVEEVVGIVGPLDLDEVVVVLAVVVSNSVVVVVLHEVDVAARL